ncbi:MAG: ATP-dependent Zn protease [Cyanobacteria bacterium P01_H01_bin.119]
MKQTTLNLIALFVFLATMASLLGPMVQISPTVPALAVAAVLALAALDRFALDGKLGSFLIDSLDRTSEAERDRILHHEAGHFLVAQLLDIPVTDYTLSPWEAWKRGLPGQGGVVFDAEAIEQEMNQGRLSAQLLSRYCTVWMAGIAAETLVFKTETGGSDDRQKIRAIYYQIQKPAQEARIKERWSILQARTLLEHNWEAYQSLVAAMAERKPVEDCRQLIIARAEADNRQTKAI